MAYEEINTMSYNTIQKVEAISSLTRNNPAVDPAAALSLFKKDDRTQPVAEDKQAQDSPAAVMGSRNMTGSLVETYVRFIVDKDSHRVRIQVLNSSNDEVIREIPPEDLAKIADDLRSYNQSVVDHRL